MTVQLIVHRGTREIGGNCVEVRTDSTRIILDVGMPLVDVNGESFDAASLQGSGCQSPLVSLRIEKDHRTRPLPVHAAMPMMQQYNMKWGQEPEAEQKWP